MKAKFLKCAVLVAAATLTASGAFAADAKGKYERPLKELKIMSNIFETSLTEQSSQTNRIIGSKKTQATYLASQGMLFSFSFGRSAFGSSGDWEEFGQNIGSFVGAIASEVSNALAEVEVAPTVPPVPPLPPVGSGYDYDYQYEENFEAYEQRMEELEEMREYQREQRHLVRELQREIRELEREKARGEKSAAEVEREQKKLEVKIAELDSQMKAYDKSMEDYRRKRDQSYIASTELKSQVIISTLCDYGPTLRSLHNNEHVTLIFTNYAGNKDQVYVFKARDVKVCEDKDKLMKRALTYQM